MQMTTEAASILRERIVEANSNIRQVEVNPETFKFEPVVVTESGVSSSIMMLGDEDIRLVGEGLTLLGGKMDLKKSTIDNLHVEEITTIFNRRKNKVKPFVADVKDDMVIGENNGSPNPADVFDACLQGIDSNEVVLGKSIVKPNYVSCDFKVNNDFDPMDIGDISSAACHFQTNGKTKLSLKIYRLACTNGMTVSRDVFSSFINEDNYDRWLLDTTIQAEKCMEAANLFSEYYGMMVDFEVEDVSATIKQLCKTHNIGKEVADMVIDCYNAYYTEMGRNAYAVMQAFTYASSHGFNDEFLSVAQSNKIDKMLTTIIVNNATQNEIHCETCGADL